MNRPYPADLLSAVLMVWEGLHHLDVALTNLADNETSKAWRGQLEDITRRFDDDLIGSLATEYPELTHDSDAASD
jgi:hypothetical protein